MEKILSQDEIDALLKGVASGEVETQAGDEGQPAGGVKSYDLFNQERIVRGRMPTLELITDRFTRHQSLSWSTLLNTKVEFNIIGTQIMKFGAFMNTVPIPSSLNVFRMDPLRGNGLFVLNAFLVYLVVDFFYGGKAQTHVKPEGRDFTPIQLRIIKKLVTLAFADMEKAWRAALAVKTALVRSEVNPQFAMVVSSSEIVFVTTLQVQFGETTSDFFLVYPYSMLEPIKEKLYSGIVSDQLEQDGSWATRFHEKLQECPVAVTVRLGTVSIKVRDVLDFAPGDLILLDQRPGDPLDCFVEGFLKFQGSPGVSKGNHACRIEKVIA
jgi:flagellar motor switch protein FliM